MSDSIEKLGGLHRADIEKMVRDEGTAVREELIPMIEKVTDAVDGLKKALLGHTDALGNKHPGALAEIGESITEVNNRVTNYDREHREEAKKRTEAEMRRHEEWQEGETVREIARAKRDEDMSKVLLQVSEKLEKLEIRVNDHDKRFVSRFARAMQWCVKTYQTGHKKYLVLAAAWASISGAIAIGVTLALKAWTIYQKFSHVIKSVFQVIKDGVGK